MNELYISEWMDNWMNKIISKWMNGKRSRNGVGALKWDKYAKMNETKRDVKWDEWIRIIIYSQLLLCFI